MIRRRNSKRRDMNLSLSTIVGAIVKIYSASSVVIFWVATKGRLAFCRFREIRRDGLFLKKTQGVVPSKQGSVD